MSPIDQVLAAAWALDASGKVPSLALIKTRLGNKLPMPILIQGLQQFKSMPKAERERLATLSIPEDDGQKTTEPMRVSITTIAAQLTELQQEFTQTIALKNTEIMQLTNELIELKQRVNQLELQGKSA